MKTNISYWLGDETSLSNYLESLKVINSDTITGVVAQALSESGEDKDELHYLLEVTEGVAVLSIDGPISSFSNEFTRWMGMVGYPDIREALVQAVNNSEVSEILLNIDSPGGSATGIEDISSLINKISTEHKPVTAYTKGTMASAAYWIASSADAIYSSKLATVGSIGVIATHFDVTKQLEEDGIKATVFRAGEYKALGGPYEELTDVSSEIIQSRLDKLYDQFLEQVSQGRNTSVELVKSNMAEGKEFFGYEAIDVGLIDGIKSIDEVVANLQTRQEHSNYLVKTQNNQDTESPVMNKKTGKKLDNKTVAIIAAGGDKDTAIAEAPEANAETAPVEAQAESTETEVETPEQSVEATIEQTDDSQLVSFLRAELSTTQEKVLELTVENKKLQEAQEQMEACHSQFRVIAEDGINTRSVALNRGSLEVKGMSDEAVIQQYRTVSADFNKAFPVGGRCEAPSQEEPKEVMVKPAHLRAVRNKN